jgi:hypothetical protein
MKYFGLEQEFFLKDTTTNELVIPESLKIHLPIDGCGYLVEARGAAYNNMYEAIYSLKAEVRRIFDLLRETKYTLSYSPVEKLSKKFLFEISKQYIKGLTKYNNYLGFINHKLCSNERTAGLHLSITDQHTYGKITYNQNFDYIDIFRKLDEAYCQEIKVAKRNPGFYEIKEDGRIEYRSLPTNIDLDKLITVVNNIIK